MNHEQPATQEGATPPAQPAATEHVLQPPIASAEQQEQPPVAPPKIWVGSWLDYNNGVLHGDWIDVARTEDEVWADIEAILKASPTARKYGEVAEDWGIFDYENFAPLSVGESETIAHVTAVARGIAEHGPAFAAWADLVQDPELLDGFDEAYLGEYDSLQAYVEQLIDDLGYDELLDRAVPPGIRPYVKIDVAATARDLQFGGDLQAVPAEGGGVWIFDAR